MGVPVVLRAAPVATPADLMEPEAVRHHEMYERSALHPHPGREVLDIPIVVSHDKAVQIGRVTALRTDECWTGGVWVWVHGVLTDPPAWLRKGAAVSISRSAYSKRTPWGADWELIQRAILTEVSILSPGVKPAHPRAQVVWIGKPEDSSAVGDSSGGELIYGGERIMRYGIGQVLGVR